MSVSASAPCDYYYYLWCWWFWDRKGCWAKKWLGYHGSYNSPPQLLRSRTAVYNPTFAHLCLLSAISLGMLSLFPLPMPLLSLVPRPLVWVRPNLLAQDLETNPGSPTGSSGMGSPTDYSRSRSGHFVLWCCFPPG